jgi:cell division protein ZapD
VPQLHHWLGTPAVARHQQMQLWLSDINLLMNAISLLLRLWRESGNFSDQIATNGFFQDTAESAELIRIRLPGAQQCYPTLSGHKNRFALRFLPTTEQQIGDVPFQLACC